MGKVEIDPELQLRINRTKAQDDVAGVVAIAFELAEKLAASRTNTLAAPRVSRV